MISCDHSTRHVGLRVCVRLNTVLREFNDIRMCEQKVPFIATCEIACRKIKKFLGATKHLYDWLCPLVGQLVGWSVGRSVGRVTHSFDYPLGWTKLHDFGNLSSLYQ